MMAEAGVVEAQTEEEVLLVLKPKGKLLKKSVWLMSITQERWKKQQKQGRGSREKSSDG